MAGRDKGYSLALKSVRHGVMYPALFEKGLDCNPSDSY
jgi:hypothetical protein